MGTTATNHPLTQVREDCFVCHQRFSDLQVNPGPAIREEHHVIPQAYGGVDGPTVSVCLHHHDLLHKVAERIAANKPIGDLVGNEAMEYLNPLLFLARKVAEAKIMMKNDPNKRVQVTLDLDGRYKEMVEKLKPTLPGKSKSREAVFLYALELLYKKQFPLN